MRTFLSRSVAYIRAEDPLHMDLEAWPGGKKFKVLKVLVRFCLEYYFKLYYMKVKHYLVDASYHILTSLRILRIPPKKAREASPSLWKLGHGILICLL